MKIFISWSGARSRAVALALKDWIPCVLHAAEPFMSEKDIAPGSGWLKEISENLSESELGIVCVTPESIDKPWLNFEAGALTRELQGKTSLVIPYLHGFRDKGFRGPLSAFQAVSSDVTGTRDLVRTLNSELSRLKQHPLTDRILSDTFDKWWPDLQRRFNQIGDVPTQEATTGEETLGGRYPYSSFYYGPNKWPRKGEVFQDFRLARNVKRGNVNAVQFLWADSGAGSYLRASIPDSEPILRVGFDNARDSYPCTVAIRGRDESPLENDPYKPFLMFGARLSNSEGSAQDSVHLGLRLVNGFLQHWSYSRRAIIATPEWNIVEVGLNDPNEWSLFQSDGNAGGPPTARFDCICSVILELGLHPAPATRGTVEIGPLVLVDDKHQYGQYLPHLSG